VWEDVGCGFAALVGSWEPGLVLGEPGLMLRKLRADKAIGSG